MKAPLTTLAAAALVASLSASALPTQQQQQQHAEARAVDDATVGYTGRAMNVVQKAAQAGSYARTRLAQASTTVKTDAKVDAAAAAAASSSAAASDAASPPSGAAAAAAASGGPTVCTTDCGSTLKLTSAAAKKYQVGNSIPQVPFKTRTSWAGLLPIRRGDPSRQLFFWLWGKEPAAAGGAGARQEAEELVIWLNGGPGCSSMNGMWQENGPISYLDKMKPPQPNPNSWTTVTNMLYIEQPVGTGFTLGTPTARDENDVAADFSDWLANFFDTFPELRKKKLYITGESYAGQYIPYISNKLYRDGNRFGLQGNLIIDGVVTDELLQTDVTSIGYLQKNQGFLNLSPADYAKVVSDATACGYVNFTRDNLVYPPKGKLPAYNTSGCNTWNDLTQGATNANANFNVYKADQKTSAFGLNPFGDPNDPDQASKPTYFDNADVRAYIHAPNVTVKPKWNLCNTDVFPNGDASPPPDRTVLASVIESAKAGVIIANGELDELIQTNGTALGLQNLTWSGQQGFRRGPPTSVLVDDAGQKAGRWQTERGLSFVIVDKAGHMIPQDTPKSGLTLIKTLLGKAKLG